MKQLILLACFLLFPTLAHAYIGPGSGFGILGVVAGILGSALLALFAILWYPIKRFLKQRKPANEVQVPAGEDRAEQ